MYTLEIENAINVTLSLSLKPFEIMSDFPWIENLEFCEIPLYGTIESIFERS